MTQVFAAINHRLSEEYGAIDLPDQEAKSRCVLHLYKYGFMLFKTFYCIRLLADAKYLQQKFSVLKNVGNSSGMLETVIAEKSLARVNTASGPSTPTRSNSLSASANQRLKGLLSGKSSSFDKTIPIPASPPPVPPSADKPRLPVPPTANNTRDYHHGMDHDRSANESQVSLGISPSPPIQKPTALPDQEGTGAGLKQVEPSSTARLEASSHLHELNNMGASSTGSGGPPPLPSTILEGGPKDT